jgi:transcriptional regulator with XRE-family HTH domain
MERSNERPGERLKRVREKLKLTFRDVEQASRQIAEIRGSSEFAIALSRLADIENKGTAPSIYRIYSLCAIYRIDYEEVLGWYGVPREDLEADAARVRLGETHAVQFKENQHVTVPKPAGTEIDLNRTSFLNHLIRRWGKLPLTLLNGLDLRRYRYGFIGLNDWSMYPVLQPGALVAIDESLRKIAAAGWAGEAVRPIYFLEYRGGYLCGWCSLSGSRLIVQPHPSSHQEPVVFESQDEVDVLGQVVGVATPLNGRPPLDAIKY